MFEFKPLERPKLRIDVSFEKSDTGRDYIRERVYSKKNPSYYTEGVRTVRPEDVERFPLEWKAYQEQVNPPSADIDGQTPLGNLAFLEVPEIEGYKLRGVRSVEQLAAADSFTLKTLGRDAAKNKELAKMFLKNRELEDLIDTSTKPKRRPREGLIIEEQS